MVSDPVAVWNERVKLSAGFINAIGLGLFGFAVLRPLTEDISNLSWPTFWWGVAGLALHVFSHYILGDVRKAST
jgi:hypothetical protein